MTNALSDVTQVRTNNHNIRYIFWQEQLEAMSQLRGELQQVQSPVCSQGK